MQEWADEEKTKPFEDVTGIMPGMTVTKIAEILHTSLREQNCIWHCFLHRTVVYFLCFHPSGANIQLESAASRGKFSLRKGLFIMTRNMISASRIITTNIWRKKHEQHYPDKN